MNNLAAVLGKTIVAYKYTEEKSLSLKLEDGTVLEVKEGHDRDENWIVVIVTAPDDDQWISMVNV